MRRPREAKPPRRPRVLTWRLVIVSLVVGVVLAVGSVPVGVAISEVPQVASQRRATVDLYSINGHETAVSRERSATLDAFVWEQGYSRPTVHVKREHRDPRPPAVRRWLGTSEGVAFGWRAGWPFRAARGEELFALRGYSGSMHEIEPTSVGVWVRTAFGHDWSIPYLPLWPGLLGNMLFYAVLVLTPFALLRWRKLRRRVRRGLCVACGYELGEGVGACPECGLARAGA